MSGFSRSLSFAATALAELRENGDELLCCVTCVILPRKSERKINFAQFQECLKLLAATKFPEDPRGVEKLTTKLTSGEGAKTNKATVSNKCVFAACS